MNFLFVAGIRRISQKSAWIHIVIVLSALNAGADSAFLSVPLQRTGVDTNANGLITINLGPTNSSMLLQASNLTRGRVYTVTSGGVPRGTFLADASGRGQLRFTQPTTTGTLPFNFDPREQMVTVVGNGLVLLRAKINGPGEPRGSIVNEVVTIQRAGSTPGGAEGRFQLGATGTRQFTMTLTNVPNGTWTLYVDGIRRGNFPVSGGSGAIAFDNAASTPARALTFDPRGPVVDIARGNVLGFSGPFRARASGINSATRSVRTFSIPPATLPAVGIARAVRWIDRDARQEFSIQLAGLPPGIYELFISDVFEDFIVVSSAGGELRFSTAPEDEEERLLDFNALTNTYTIASGGQLLFQGQPVADAVQVPPAVAPTRLQLPLFNLGRDADGTARATFKRDELGRRRFAVEVKNTPAGDYYLTLNGLAVGIFKVVEEGNGTRGVIEFEDQPEFDELPLTFDPLGQVIGLERRQKQYFERVFPENP